MSFLRVHFSAWCSKNRVVHSISYFTKVTSSVDRSKLAFARSQFTRWTGINLNLIWCCQWSAAHIRSNDSMTGCHLQHPSTKTTEADHVSILVLMDSGVLYWSWDAIVRVFEIVSMCPWKPSKSPTPLERNDIFALVTWESDLCYEVNPMAAFSLSWVLSDGWASEIWMPSSQVQSELTWGCRCIAHIWAVFRVFGVHGNCLPIVSWMTALKCWRSQVVVYHLCSRKDSMALSASPGRFLHHHHPEISPPVHMSNHCPLTCQREETEWLSVGAPQSVSIVYFVFSWFRSALSWWLSLLSVAESSEVIAYTKVSSVRFV